MTPCLFDKRVQRKAARTIAIRPFEYERQVAAADEVGLADRRHAGRRMHRAGDCE
jgi:hypothetical protein